MDKTFAFNFTFTRADENHATTYTVGMNVDAADRASAEIKLRERNAHLSISSVELFAIMDDEGTISYPEISTAELMEIGTAADRCLAESDDFHICEQADGRLTAVCGELRRRANEGDAVASTWLNRPATRNPLR
jgi:hypothetical protein